MSTRQVIHQFNGKMTYNGQRIYIDKATLESAGFKPGTKFQTITDPSEHTVEFLVDAEGSNTVSKKTKKNGCIPVIDRQGKDIREALEDCDQIKVTFVQDRVIIEGMKQTAKVRSQAKSESNQLRTITFCAGAGISSECMKKAGFEEVAAVEWNPKEGSEDKFSDIYLENHPESVMFNIPMQQLKASDLPHAEVWLATLDCSDFSKASNGTKKQYHTMHLFMHLMRIFWEKPIHERPLAILIENVTEFEKVAGISLELCFKEEGYHVSKAKLNSLDYGSRTKRERFFMVASVYPGFLFPEKSGVKQTSIAEAGIISPDELEWVSPEESGTLRYFLERESKGISHNHHMTVFDVTKDAYLGTITKNHFKIQPENWIKHPTEENKYAYLKGEQIRALHQIDKQYYLGNSNKMVVECIGQSVCTQSFTAIAEALFTFLYKQNLNQSLLHNA